LREEARLPFGGTRDEYWQKVLGPLAKTSKEVTIFDRYLFSELMRRRQFQGRQQPEEALIWLLQMLDAHGSDGLVVQLFAATLSPNQRGRAQHPASAQQAAELVQRSWNRSSSGSIARVEVIAGDWRQAGSAMPHDRHMRFGGNRAVSISAGFDRLKSQTIQDSAGMAWQYHWTSSSVAPLVASERELEAGSGTSRIVL
jgi:hypothetical protein